MTTGSAQVSSARAATGRAGGATPLWARSLVAISVFVAILYVVEAIDALTGFALDDAGIEPREADGLVGVAVSPLLHSGWDHLVSNTGPAVILGFLVLMARRFVVTTAIAWLVSGLGVWLFAPAHTVTVGLSGVIFGWLAFLLLRGLFNRNGPQILLGVLLFMLYGGVLWAMLPGTLGVSWQAHMFGALGGALAAWYLSRRDRNRPSGGRLRGDRRRGDRGSDVERVDV